MENTNEMISNELADLLQSVIDDYTNVYADCTKENIQKALKKLMRNNK